MCLYFTRVYAHEVLGANFRYKNVKFAELIRSPRASPPPPPPVIGPASFYNFAGMMERHRCRLLRNVYERNDRGGGGVGKTSRDRRINQSATWLSRTLQQSSVSILVSIIPYRGYPHGFFFLFFTRPSARFHTHDNPLRTLLRFSCVLARFPNNPLDTHSELVRRARRYRESRSSVTESPVVSAAARRNFFLQDVGQSEANVY